MAAPKTKNGIAINAKNSAYASMVYEIVRTADSFKVSELVNRLAKIQVPATGWYEDFEVARTEIFHIVRKGVEVGCAIGLFESESGNTYKVL